MIGRLAALILISITSQTGGVPHQIPVTVANLGDNLTLTCPISGDRAGLFYWYKLKFGHMFQVVAKGTHGKLSLQEEFNNPRFTVKKDAVYFLNITDVHKEDEGTYICQAGSVYEMKFTNGTVLAVRDHKTEQKSVYLKQNPLSETLEPEDQVNLQCSLLSRNKGNTAQCLGEHQCPNVHWFRAGLSPSHSIFIYTDGNSSDTDGKSCHYSLTDSLDEGTYYCAVVTCGRILFGDGTRVVQKTGCGQLLIAIVIGTPLVCCAIVIAVIVISRNRKAVCGHCNEVTDTKQREHYRSDESDSNHLDEEEAQLNYAALDFPSQKRESRMTRRELPQDCLYT